MAMIYIFTTFASAEDVAEVKQQISNIEVRMIKSDIRELRKQIRNDPDDDSLQDELEELIDDLCLMVPKDRECK